MYTNMQEGVFRQAVKPAKQVGKAAAQIAKAVQKMDKRIDKIEYQLSTSHDVYKNATYKAKLKQLLDARNILADKIKVDKRESKFVSTASKEAEEPPEAETGENEQTPETSKSEQPLIQTKDGGYISKQAFEMYKKEIFGESKKIFDMITEIVEQKSLDKLFQTWLSQKASSMPTDDFNAYAENADKVRMDFVSDLKNKFGVSYDLIKTKPRLKEAYEKLLSIKQQKETPIKQSVETPQKKEEPAQEKGEKTTLQSVPQQGKKEVKLEKSDKGSSYQNRITQIKNLFTVLKSVDYHTKRGKMIAD